jgi:hypothetical protein
MTAALGVVINVATGAKHSLAAWVAVVLISLLVAGGTAASERRRRASPSGAGTRIEASGTGRTTETYGLVARRTVTTSSDGSRTEMFEFYSEEVAKQAFGETDD